MAIELEQPAVDEREGLEDPFGRVRPRMPCRGRERHVPVPFVAGRGPRAAHHLQRVARLLPVPLQRAAPTASISGRALARHSRYPGLRVRAPGDPAPGAEPHPVARELERPDRHAQLEARDRAGVADRARVRLARGRLELRDHLHRLDLGRAGHRPGRERAAHEVAVAHPRRERAGHLRHEMPHARPGPRARAAVRAPCRTRTTCRCRCASGRRSSRSRRGPWPRPAPSARSRPAPVPLIGALSTSRPLRRRKSSGERLATAPHGPREDAACRARARRRRGEQVERVTLEPRLEPQAEVRLVEVAGGDVAAARPPRRCARPGRRPNGPAR